MENIEENKPICIIEVNENLRRVRLGQELTRPLKQLNKNCHFKEKYEEMCDIEDGIERFSPKMINCPICNKEFKQKKFNQKYCNTKCSKKGKLELQRKYAIENKEEISRKRKIWYYKNRDTLLKKQREYYKNIYSPRKRRIN